MEEKKPVVKKKLHKKKHIATVEKKKTSLAFKFGVGICTSLLILVCLVIGGFFYVTNRYYNMLDFAGNDNTDVTLAPGATLDDEDEETEEGTDSPSHEIAAIDQMLNDLLNKYQQEHSQTSDITTPTTDEKVESSVADNNQGQSSSGQSSGGTSTSKPKPTFDPNSSNGSGIVSGGVGNAEMPSVGVDPDVTNILLIGIDSRSNNNAGRSDSMIIMSINKKTKQITLTSILRDCYVAIPGHGNNRINAAHAYGGANLLKQTIELNFGIHIDYFARVNFFSFVDIVNACGTVTINVAQNEIKYINSYMNSFVNITSGYYGSYEDHYVANPGVQELDGVQALSYARIRYVGSDYARTQRQRTVIMAVVQKMRQMSVFELDAFLGKALPKISTDLTQDVANSLVLSVPSLLGYNVVQHRIPADGTGNGMKINGKSVIAVDLIANRNLLNQIIYGR